MAFNLKNWSRQSVALNTGEVLVDSVPVGGPGFFTYRSAGDTLATISAANYFSSAAFDLYVDDLIYVQGTDVDGWLLVAAVSRTANPATITTTSTGFASTVGTANITNLAVTTAKIDDLGVTTGKLAANSVTSAKVALNVLQYATVAITASEFNGMYAAPKQLVAAGGANTLIVLDKVDLLMTYVGANYASGGVAAVQYDNTANGAGVIASSTLAAATFQAAASTGFMFNTGVVAQTFTTCVNKGLFISNVTGAFTTGDSTFVAHVWYKVVATV